MVTNKQPTLVVLQLTGGNDALNTVVPYADGLYYDNRKNVLTAVNFGRGLPRSLSLSGVPVASVAQLDGYGLLTSLASVDQRNSALEVFSSMYDDGFNDDGHVKAMKPVHADDPMSDVLS